MTRYIEAGEKWSKMKSWHVEGNGRDIAAVGVEGVCFRV